jgi:hypothetical protein
MSLLKSRLPAVAAAALLVGSLAFALPVHADTTTTTTSTQTDSDQPMSDTDTTAAPAKGSMMKKHGMENVEERIQTLHDKLKITAAEENDWKAVAQTMRDNESEIGQLISERHANGDAMSAVDDLQSYQKITQAHAEGLQKMISSFQPLYNDMSDSQKKNADQVFGHFEGRHHDMKKNG